MEAELREVPRYAFVLAVLLSTVLIFLPLQSWLSRRRGVATAELSAPLRLGAVAAALIAALALNGLILG